MREFEPSLIERQYVLSALGLTPSTSAHPPKRIDSRQPLQSRPLKLSFPDASDYDLSGSCECLLGRTRVLAQVSAELVAPRSDRPYEGFLTLSCELSPMCAASYEPGRPSEVEQSLNRLLGASLSRTHAVDLESLCLVAGELVWAVRVDVHVLDDEGSLGDAASIAVVGALRHWRRGDVSVEGTGVTIFSTRDRVPLPLAIHHTPYILTFALLSPPPSVALSSSTSPIVVLLDPSLLETSLAEGFISVTVNPQGEVCAIEKDGGVALGIEEVEKVVSVAARRAKEIEELVKDGLRKAGSEKVVR